MLYSECNKHAVLAAADNSHVETMGSRIRELRKARGLTQAELATLCGVTTSAVSQWELDQTANIKLKAFLLACQALRTDFAYLVYGSERKERPEHRAPKLRK